MKIRFAVLGIVAAGVPLFAGALTVTVERGNAKAVQEALNRPERPLVVEVPKGVYDVRETLRIGSGTTLRADPGARFVMNGETEHDCDDFLLANADGVNGNCDITVEGGVWDGNKEQGFNVKPPDSKRLDARTWSGTLVNFRKVKNLKLLNMRLANSVCYFTRFCEIDGFEIRGIRFVSPIVKNNQDGLHFCGFCFNGVVEDVVAETDGQPNDDLVALNADDATDIAGNRGTVNGPITNIVFRKLHAEDCHCLARVLRAYHDIRDIRFENCVAGCRHGVINGDDARKWMVAGRKDRARALAELPPSTGVADGLVFRNLTCWTTATNAWCAMVRLDGLVGPKGVTFENFRRDWTRDVEPTRKLAFDDRVAGMLGLTPPLALPFDSTVVVTGREVTTTFALKELNEIVKKATGKEFKAKVGGEGERRTAHRIFLGRSEEAEKILGAAFFDGLKSEESVVKAVGDDLFLAGGDPVGVLWAVYDFVEDNLGYDWSLRCPDAQRAKNERVDTCETVVYKGIPSRRRPGFTGLRHQHGQSRPTSLYRLRQRSNREVAAFVPAYRHPLRTRIFGHGFGFYAPTRSPVGRHWFDACIAKTNSYVPAKIIALGDVFKTHPEYFSLDEHGKRVNNRQLCLSGEATRKHLAWAMSEWMGHAGPGVYMFGVNDDHSGRLCCCEGCVALEEKYRNVAGPLWDCVLYLCDEVRKRGFGEGYYIQSLAYRGQTSEPPEGVTFPDNFICDDAPVTYDHTPSEMPDRDVGYGRKSNFLGSIRNWCKAAKHVTYWYYGPDNEPAQAWGRMNKELEEVYDAGMGSVGSCVGYSAEFEDVEEHLFFWKLYYPKGDLRAEFRRVCNLKYGPAAAGVVRYTDVLERIRARMAKTVSDGRLKVLDFATGEEYLEMLGYLDDAQAKAKGTPYAAPVSWARMTLDLKCYLNAARIRAIDPSFDRTACETRLRAASDDYYSKRETGKKNDKTNVMMLKLDEFANYENLKSDELPEELRQYPREKVHRVLPPRPGPLMRAYGYAMNDVKSSVPDPLAVCGYAISGKLSDGYCADQGVKVMLHDWPNAPLCTTPYLPKSFWKKDRYSLLKLGRSKYGPITQVLFWDKKMQNHPGEWGHNALIIHLLSRYFDGIRLDKKFETWISLRAEGPNFFPGDTCENRLYVEQLFVVELD